MSGWNSKTEVIEVVKATIAHDTNRTGLPRDPAQYNIAGIVRENFYNRGSGYGWGTTTGAEEFVASLRKNLRKAGH